MGNWVLKSEGGETQMNVNAEGSGVVGGTITFHGVQYAVSGVWAAAGSVPGRNYSAFAVQGGDGQSAPEFIAAAGTMKGPGNAPDSVSINLIRTDSTDGLQYGWDGTLVPG